MTVFSAAIRHAILLVFLDLFPEIFVGQDKGLSGQFSVNEFFGFQSVRSVSLGFSGRSEFMRPGITR